MPSLGNADADEQRARAQSSLVACLSYTGIVAKNQFAGIGTLRSHFPRRAMTSPAAPVALFGSTGGVGPSGRPAPKTGGSGAHGLSAETALAVRPRPWLPVVQISPRQNRPPPRAI